MEDMYLYQDIVALWKDIVRTKIDSFFTKTNATDCADQFELLITDLCTEVCNYFENALPNLNHQNTQLLFFNILKQLLLNKSYITDTATVTKLQITYESQQNKICFLAEFTNENQKVKLTIGYDAEQSVLTYNTEMISTQDLPKYKTIVVLITDLDYNHDADEISYDRNKTGDISGMCCWGTTVNVFTSTDKPQLGDKVYKSSHISTDNEIGYIVRIKR